MKERPVEVEKIAEVKRFTREAKEALKREGYIIYELTGQSIRSLRIQGRRFDTTWHKSYPEFENLPSRVSEVAIKPEHLFLPQSNGKTLNEQDEMVNKFSSEFEKRVPEVKAVVGEAADYVELALMHRAKTKKYLFGEEYNYNYTKTKTTTIGSGIAIVGHYAAGRGLRVLDFYPPVQGYHSDRFGVAPLVVPA